MRIDISKFGTTLISRPAGREAYLSARAYSIPKEGDEPIELDFSKINVLTPSWADEFVSGLKNDFGSARIKIIEGDNLSVKTTFETLNASAVV
jgi:hypothetical protein